MENLSKTAYETKDLPSSDDSSKFMELLKGENNSKDFMDSLREPDVSGKSFMETLTAGLYPKTGGKWEGKEGDSKWLPDPDKTPENTQTNPEGKSWETILDENDIDGVPFNDGEPDFTEVSKGTVEIEDFSEDRDDNFDAADEKLAEEKGCSKDDVRNWRKEHQYTWHERSDMRTMDKVPRTVHGNIPHEGGISAKKKENENA